MPDRCRARVDEVVRGHFQRGRCGDTVAASHHERRVGARHGQRERSSSHRRRRGSSAGGRCHTWRRNRSGSGSRRVRRRDTGKAIRRRCSVKTGLRPGVVERDAERGFEFGAELLHGRFVAALASVELHESLRAKLVDQVANEKHRGRVVGRVADGAGWRARACSHRHVSRRDGGGRGRARMCGAVEHLGETLLVDVAGVADVPHVAVNQLVLIRPKGSVDRRTARAGGPPIRAWTRSRCRSALSLYL